MDFQKQFHIMHIHTFVGKLISISDAFSIDKNEPLAEQFSLKIVLLF